MEKNKLTRILIANRGEIALRIIRAVHSLGKIALVVHSSSDRDLPFVKEADEAFSLALDLSPMIRMAWGSGPMKVIPSSWHRSANSAFSARNP